MKSFKLWLKNAPIVKKFLPLQVVMVILLTIISVTSVVSINAVNTSYHQIIEVNVEHTQNLNEIIRTMYTCRVLGRDILLQEDTAKTEELYTQYVASFDSLDAQMDTYKGNLTGETLTVFKAIIEEKNEYKESMLLSADIKMAGGAYEDALLALTIVTPIANDFFNSIDAFLANEELLMKTAVEENDRLVNFIIVTSICLNLFIIITTFILIKFFSKEMSYSLIRLEKSVSSIAKTGNMKTKIPADLYTNDETGRIAQVVDTLKNMLLQYSFTDTLTGGLNAKAYYEELTDIFAVDSEKPKKFWCIIADMNNLKGINDELGHAQGDIAIVSCYKILAEGLERCGKTFRLGGDEFISIAYDCTEEDLKQTLDKISTCIDEANAHPDHKFSIAYGFKMFEGTTREEYKILFESVDQEMYQNKLKMKEARLNSRIDYAAKTEAETETN